MAGLQDIRRRIRSVKNTQQVTKAMKMISAVKLRKSKERLLALRPYSDKIMEIVRSVVTRFQDDASTVQSPIAQAFLAPREEKKIRLVVIASDKGLCGGFNANVLRQATQFVHSSEGELAHLDVVGKRALEWAKKNGYTVDQEFLGVGLPNLAHVAEQISTQAAAQYEAGEIDALYVVYNYFSSALTQISMVHRIFPMEIDSRERTPVQVPHLLEPSPTLVLTALLPRFIETAFLATLLESSASEHGARMAAMDKASSNAEDMIARLTLHMNKIRQASITNQIIEIVSGANA
jgi:F-type H+-transporting ATPase subunit gamma